MRNRAGLRARAVGDREHGIDLVFLEVRHGRHGGATRRDGLDGRRVIDELWSLPRDEAEQRDPGAVVEALRGEVASLADRNRRLEHLIRELRRLVYG